MPETAAKTYGEIVNPSDYCTIETTDWPAACLAILALGTGRYSIRETDGRRMPLFLIGGHEEWLMSEFGKPLDALWESVGDSRIATALESVVIGNRDAHDAFMRMAAPGEEPQYEAAWLNKERSSLNDICARAAAYASAMRERIVETAEKASEAGS